MKNPVLFGIVLLGIIFSSCKKTPPPKPVMPVPTQQQIEWNQMERNAFIHFGLNTFNDMEWGYGDSPASTFNPSELDANQWCDVIKKAGLKGVILTAKHHDGFCLWPTKTTEYSVKNSPWQNGEGDLVKEVSEACKKHGLKFGIYLSPWDRNIANYGSQEYIEVFRAQLTELLTNYGDVFEVWFDGANGGSGYYGGSNESRSVDRKTYYDWPTTIELVRKLQPNALLFSDAGPDIRWCGNESGIGGKTNWAALRRDEAWPGWPRYKELTAGHEDGNYWVPAEINTSIRPGWFYHKSEDHQVKSLTWLMDYYYESVGRNGTALLNFPVDHRGLIHETDAANVIEWQKLLEKEFEFNLLTQNTKLKASNTRGGSKAFSVKNVSDQDFETYWATDDEVIKASIEIDFGEIVSINRFLVQEYIALGQRVKEFKLEALTKNGSWKKVALETTIGYKRILRFPTVTTQKLRFSILDAKACPTISNIEVYNAPQILFEPHVSRNKNGEVAITTNNNELEIYYTLDKNTPDKNSEKYTTPFQSKGKIEVTAVAYDPISGKYSKYTREEFDIDKTKWEVENFNDKNSEYIFDGNIHTAWYVPSSKMPADLIIDLGEEQSLIGFKYLPDQSRWGGGVVFNYEFQISPDGKKWKTKSKGEFSNINNHPIMQTKNFSVGKARFVKLRAVNNTDNDHRFGIAEFDLVTVSN